MQPLCRLCGKPIRRSVRWLRFGEHTERRYAWENSFTEKPATKAEAARFDNGQIISIRWSHDRAYIKQATVWNGEYVSPYFCKDECARRFGHFALEQGFDIQTQAYFDAFRAALEDNS